MKNFLTALLFFVLVGLIILFAFVAHSQGAAWGSSPSVVTEKVSSDTATAHPSFAAGYDGWFTAWAYGPGWEVKYEAGHLVAARRAGVLYIRAGGKWVEQASPPKDPEVLDMLPIENFGIDQAERAKAPAGKFFKGEPITKAQAVSLIEKGAEIPLDKAGWLIFVGPKSRAAEVQRQLDLCPKLKNLVWFQAYDPKDWPVEAFALNTHPKFKGEALFLECLDGRVCHGQYDLKPDDLKNLEQNFKPEAVPDIREKGLFQKAMDYADENPLPCCVGAVVIAIYLKRRQPAK
jgi:hypothetical protein